VCGAPIEVRYPWKLETAAPAVELWLRMYCWPKRSAPIGSELNCGTSRRVRDCAREAELDPVAVRAWERMRTYQAVPVEAQRNAVARNVLVRRPLTVAVAEHAMA
jgi:hypothetical protein